MWSMNGPSHLTYVSLFVLAESDGAQTVMSCLLRVPFHALMNSGVTHENVMRESQLALSMGAL